MIYWLPFILLGCQSGGWYPDDKFGSSVNQAISDQIANKNAPDVVNRSSMGMDGPTAKSTIDNYQKSFEQPSGSTVSGNNSSGIFNPMGSSNSSLPSITGR
jgi:hypothetical protein